MRNSKPLTKPQGTGIWNQPDFIKLFSSQTIQAVAFVLLQVVIMVEVYNRTGSVFSSASVLAIFAFGSFIGGIIGSYYLHRVPLVRLIHLLGWARGGIVLALGYLLSTQGGFSWGLFILLFVQAIIGSWYQPARFALLPLIVSKEKYMQANGTLSIIHQLFLTAGWGFGGVLMILIPFFWLIIIVALFFILSGIIVSFIKVPRGNGQDNGDHSMQSDQKLIPAWKKVFTYPIIRTVTIMDFFENLANVVGTSAFILAFTVEVLGRGTDWWGYINASYWIGGMIGSVIVLALTKFMEKRVGFVIILSSLFMSVLVALFALIPIPWLTLAFCLLMGPVFQSREICQETIMQDVLQANERASVMSARSAILTPWYGGTFLVMGFVSDLIGIQGTYLIGAGLYGLTFLIAILQPQLRGYRFVTEEQVLTK